MILHKGVAGKVYNIGGSTEKANIEVAKDLIRLMGKGDEEDKYMTFVPDRAFNDRRYTSRNRGLFSEWSIAGAMHAPVVRCTD